MKELCKTKIAYEQSEILKNSKKGIWSLINKNANNGQDVLKIQLPSGEVTEDEEQIAKCFAEFFSGKIEKLKRSPNVENVINTLSSKYSNCKKWSLEKLSVEEVAKLIDGLPQKKSYGPDGISYDLIKTFKHEAIIPLTEIINQSLLEGKFHGSWTLSKVRPVHKKGSWTLKENFRPVCLTSCVGRLVEAAFQRQLKQNVNHLLPDSICGYRNKSGTESALIRVLDTVKEALSNKKKVAIIALDASSAFDLLSRDLVIKSMKILGANLNVVNWLLAYFSNRRMFVQVGKSCSETWIADIGVIQGGKCSGELYNIASITQSMWNFLSVSTQYADDNVEIIIADSVEECQSLVKDAADKMVDWYLNTGFSLNSKKSEIISFNCDLNPILIENEEVHPKKSMKFLGLFLQSNLKWDQQIEFLSNRIRYASARIRNEGKLYSVGDKKKLYFAWIQGLLRSNLLAYMPYVTETQLNTLQKAANAGIRAVISAKRYGHIPLTEIRKELDIPSVKDLVQRAMCYEAWKNRNHFRQISDASRDTRAKSSGNVIIKNAKSWNRQTTFLKLSEAWNLLPKNLKDSESDGHVKSSLKKRFHNQLVTTCN